MQLKLPKPISDHAPILLDRREGGVLRRGSTPFHFENMGLKVEGFQDLMKGWWQGGCLSAGQLATFLQEK